MSDMDNVFRNKLEGHGTPLSEDMWSRMEIGLKNKKRRKGLLFLLFTGLAVVSIAGVSIYGYSNLKNIENVSEEDVLFTEIKENAESEVLNISSPAAPEKSITKDEQINLPVNKIDIKNNEITIKEGNGELSEESGLSSKTSSNKESTPRSKRELIVVPSQDFQGLENPLLSKKATTISEKLTIDQLANISALSLEHFEIQARIFQDPIGCPSFSQRSRQNFFVEAYYKPLFAYSMIASNSSEIGQSYIDLRRDSETPLYSWSAGAYVGWISNYDVGVKAGIEYEVINERFTYEDPEAIRNQTVITIDTMFNTDGTFDINSDTSVVQVSGTEIQNIINYHKTLSIPIHALYQMNFNNFAVELSGGPIFNINYSNRGKIVDPSNEDQWFTKGETGSYDVFKDRLSVSFLLSASMMYSINEKIQLFVRPEFKFHPTSISKTTSPFTQKYLNSGVSLGARYYFTGNPNY